MSFYVVLWSPSTNMAQQERRDDVDQDALCRSLAQLPSTGEVRVAPENSLKGEALDSSEYLQRRIYFHPNVHYESATIRVASHGDGDDQISSADKSSKGAR